VEEDGINAQILLVGPDDGAAVGAHGAKIGFVAQFVEGAAVKVGLYVEDTGDAIPGEDFDSVIIQ